MGNAEAEIQARIPFVTNARFNATLKPSRRADDGRSDEGGTV
jgi:hypothetical protein